MDAQPKVTASVSRPAIRHVPVPYLCRCRPSTQKVQVGSQKVHMGRKSSRKQEELHEELQSGQLHTLLRTTAILRRLDD